MPAISVVLCTHNPRKDILARTLKALKGQTLSISRWELLIVDNASSPPLDRELNLSWHCDARILKEPEIGANPAHQRGLRESQSDVTVLVDDDNLLSPDYLSRVLEIANRWPILGAWGGSNVGEFEVTPPPWLIPYLSILAVRVINRPFWTSIEGDLTMLPFGAGLCVRRVVAQRYMLDVAKNPLKQVLGRRDNYDISGEDPDIASTAFDLNLGIGLFPELSLRHYLSAARLKPEPLLRVVRGNSAGVVILNYLRNRLDCSRFRRGRRLREVFKVLCLPSFNRRIHLARLQGEIAAFRALNAFISGRLRTADEFRAAFIDNLSRSFF